MKAYTHFLIHQLREERGYGPRQISEKLGVPLRTVERHLAMPKVIDDKPPRERPSILDPHKERIEALLKEGLTGAQILFRLQRDGYQGGKTILNDHIRKVRPPRQEAFLTLRFDPGEMAQVDFAECGLVRAGNIRRKLYAFLMTLGHSRRVFVKFVMRQNTEHFLACHREGFEFFGGVPRRVMVDNCKVAVLRHDNIYAPPEINPRYADFAAHYGFVVSACNVRSPNEKGRVERSVGYLRTSFLNGLDTSRMSLLAVNAAAREWQTAVADRRMLARTRQTPMQLFPEERTAMLPLPPHPYDCSVFSNVRVSSQCRVSFEGNLYSAPMRHAGAMASLAALPDTVRIHCDGKVVAEHARSYERGKNVVEPAHDIELLKRRKKATKAKILELFLDLSPQAADYVAGLRSRRPDADMHLARIMALTTTHTQGQVADALNEAMEMSAYGAEYIANLLDMRRRVREELPPLRSKYDDVGQDIEISQPDMDVYERR